MLIDRTQGEGKTASDPKREQEQEMVHTDSTERRHGNHQLQVSKGVQIWTESRETCRTNGKPRGRYRKKKGERVCIYHPQQRKAGFVSYRLAI